MIRIKVDGATIEIDTPEELVEFIRRGKEVFGETPPLRAKNFEKPKEGAHFRIRSRAGRPRGSTNNTLISYPGSKGTEVMALIYDRLALCEADEEATVSAPGIKAEMKDLGISRNYPNTLFWRMRRKGFVTAVPTAGGKTSTISYRPTEKFLKEEYPRYVERIKKTQEKSRRKGPAT